MTNIEKTDQMVDILRVEGIMAQGYGLNPKMVMRDKRLTPVAKCIYSYIASFAGGGNQSFPSRNIMLDELQISKDTYYKHLKLLLKADYIKIEQQKMGGGIFDRNIYTIVSLPNPVEEEKSTFENTCTNQNSTRESNQKNKSAGKQKESGAKKLKVKERASVKELRERLEIDNLKLSDPNNEELIEEVFMAIEDMNSSEQISIGGNVKKRDAIESLLNQLTADHVRLVTQIMANNNKPIKKRKAYLQTCIANSIFDIRNKNVEAKNIISKKEQDEIAEKEKRQKEAAEKQKLLNAYKQYPELKKIDKQITETMKKISRAVLSGNEILYQSLKNKNEKLEAKRTKILEKNGVKLSI